TSFSDEENTVYLHICTRLTFTRLPIGDLSPIKSPFFIGLAHELIHATHGNNGDHRKEPTIDLEYDNLEEQITISGVGRPIIGTLQYENFPINENSIRAAFNLPPRVNHKALITIEKPSSFKELTKEVCLYIHDIASFGYKKGLEKLIKNGFKINEKINNKTLLEIHFLDGNLCKKTAKFLIKCGATVNPIDENGRSLLGKLSGNYYRDSKKIDFIKQCGAQLSKHDLSFDLEDEISMVMEDIYFGKYYPKNGCCDRFDPFELNKQGFGAIAYCIRSQERGESIQSILTTLEYSLRQSFISELTLNLLSGYGNQTFRQWLTKNRDQISEKTFPLLYQSLL
nr:hypothetical protein [Nitrosopumilus sp.]